MIGLSPSTYYYTPKRSRASREREDAELRDAIEAVQVEFPKAGYRTAQRYLRRQGRFVGERKIRRIMRQFSLHAEIKRAFVVTTDSNHAHRAYPNLLPGRRLTGINQAWAADVTYVPMARAIIGGFEADIAALYSLKSVYGVAGQAAAHRLRVTAGNKRNVLPDDDLGYFIILG